MLWCNKLTCLFREMYLGAIQMFASKAGAWGRSLVTQEYTQMEHFSVNLSGLSLRLAVKNSREQTL